MSTERPLTPMEEVRENAYLDGQDACAAGILRGQCPFTDGTLRKPWIDGWDNFNVKYRIPWEQHE